MPIKIAAACAAAAACLGAPAAAQVGGAVTAPIARPTSSVAVPPVAGPPAPFVPAAPRAGPLPARLSLPQALAEATARSPTLVAVAADLEAARGRLKQAGYRVNPELSVDVENFAGSGAFSGFNGTETTVSINQRLDLGGRRSSRIASAQAALDVQALQLSIARADIEQSVRRQFALAVAARERLAVARSNEELARELARIASELVDAGREPPLRGFRAKAGLSRATAEANAAEAEELAARRTFAALLGAETPPAELIGAVIASPVQSIDSTRTLAVRLAVAQTGLAEAELRQQRAAGRLDPSVGIGVRQISETGDRAIVAGFSVPLQIFDRNQGNIAAARSGVVAAGARRAAAIATASAEISNARTALDAAAGRVDALDGVAVPQAREALRLSELSYRAGKTALIELLDAQQTLSLAQSELIDARLAHAEAAAALARAAAQ